MAARRAREWSWGGPARAMCDVSEQTQPSCRDKVSGWQLAGPASDND